MRIQGGVPSEKESESYFYDDLKQFNKEGCMSANIRPGVCVGAPCIVYGDYMKPKLFENGSIPVLKQSQFHSIRNKSSGEFVAPPNNPPAVVNQSAKNDLDFIKREGHGFAPISARNVA